MSQSYLMHTKQVPLECKTEYSTLIVYFYLA
jgi:hypothetical protein